MEAPRHFGPDGWASENDGYPDCEYCRNKRLVLGDDGHLKACPECEVAVQYAIKAMDGYSSRTPASRKQTFDNFNVLPGQPENRVLTACRDLARKFATACVEGFSTEVRWLVFWGERGCGKSHLMAAVDNYLTSRNKAVIYTTMTELMASLWESIKLDKNTERDTMQGRLDSYKAVPVLILDDLGAEQNNEFTQGIVFQLLDHRYKHRLPTMIATNLNLDDPENGLDLRVLDRLKDKRLSIVKQNPAPSYRLRGETQDTF